MTWQIRLERGDPEFERQRQLLTHWWSLLRDCGDPGAASWEDLEFIEQQVAEQLLRGNIRSAQSLTCKAALLIQGEIEC